jgi:hypothetical protein
VKRHLTFRRDGIVTCYRGATAASLKRGRDEYRSGWWAAHAVMDRSVEAVSDPVRIAQQEERQRRFIELMEREAWAEQLRAQGVIADDAWLKFSEISEISADE